MLPIGECHSLVDTHTHTHSRARQKLSLFFFTFLRRLTYYLAKCTFSSHVSVKFWVKPKQIGAAVFLQLLKTEEEEDQEKWRLCFQGHHFVSGEECSNFFFGRLFPVPWYQPTYCPNALAWAQGPCLACNPNHYKPLSYHNSNSGRKVWLSKKVWRQDF